MAAPNCSSTRIPAALSLASFCRETQNPLIHQRLRAFSGSRDCSQSDFSRRQRVRPLFRKSDLLGSLLTCVATERGASSFSPDGGQCAAIGHQIKKQNLVKMFEKLLTPPLSYGFMSIDETQRQDPRCPHQTRR